jgi:hypothetical protein
MRYYWCSIILFSFPSFPELHRVVVQLLQTCSTTDFVYDCFVYMHISWIYLPHMKKNMWPLSFWAWLTSHNMISSNCIHLPSNHISLFTPLCIYIYIYIYIPQFLDPFDSCRASMVVSRAWLLWMVLWWTSVHRCLYCILSCVPLGRRPGAVSLDHMAVLSFTFWGISILLSLVIVLICIPTSSV